MENTKKIDSIRVACEDDVALVRLWQIQEDEPVEELCTDGEWRELSIYRSIENFRWYRRKPKYVLVAKKDDNTKNRFKVYSLQYWDEMMPDAKKEGFERIASFYYKENAEKAQETQMANYEVPEECSSEDVTVTFKSKEASYALLQNLNRIADELYCLAMSNDKSPSELRQAIEDLIGIPTLKTKIQIMEKFILPA